MAGRMNWSRVQRETRMARYERVAPPRQSQWKALQQLERYQGTNAFALELRDTLSRTGRYPTAAQIAALKKIFAKEEQRAS